VNIKTLRRRPDYAAIARMEREVWGQAFEHAGVPASPRPKGHYIGICSYWVGEMVAGDAPHVTVAETGLLPGRDTCRECEREFR